MQPIITLNGTVLPAILLAPLQNVLCPLESVTFFHCYIAGDGQCPVQRTLNECLENFYCIKVIQLRALLRKLCEERGCHRLNVYVPPNSCVEVLTSNRRVLGGEAFGKQVGLSWIGLLSLSQGPRDRSCPVHLWGYGERSATSEPRGRLPRNLWCLDLGLPAPWLWETPICCSSHPVTQSVVFLWWQPEWTKTLVKHLFPFYRWRNWDSF